MPLEVGEPRFVARCMGRKIPEVGAEVVKYCALWYCQAMRPYCRTVNLPLKVASVLPSIGERFAQLYAGKDAWLVANAADVLDDTVHTAGHIDAVTHVDAAAVGAHLAVRSGGVPYEGVQGGFPRNSGAGG